MKKLILFCLILSACSHPKEVAPYTKAQYDSIGRSYVYERDSLIRFYLKTKHVDKIPEMKKHYDTLFLKLSEDTYKYYTKD